MSVSRSVTTTFSELAEKRMPQVFAALEARESIARLKQSLGVLSLAPSDAERVSAEEMFTRDAAALEEIIVSLDVDGADFADQLTAFRTATGVVSKSVSDKHTARDALSKSLERARVLHADLRKTFLEVADETAFQMTLTSEEARASLTSGFDALVMQDVPRMIALMKVRSGLTAIGHQFDALGGLVDAALAAARTDALLSSIDNLKSSAAELGDSLEPSVKSKLETFIASIDAGLLEMAPSAEARRQYLGGEKYADVKALLDALSKDLGALVDDASFEMSINGDELSTSSGDAFDRIASSAEGDFRTSLEAIAAINLAMGWLGEFATAETEDDLAVIVQRAVAVREQLQLLGAAPILAGANTAEALGELDGMLAADGPMASARTAIFLADAQIDKSGVEAERELAALSDRVGALADAQRLASDAAVKAAESAVADGRIVQIGIASISILVVFGIAVFFIRPKIVKPLRNMRAAVAQLAAGVPTQVPGAERRDEIGDLAQSMSAIYDSAVAAQRVETALSSSNAMVLIADAEGRIGYVNARLQEFFNSYAEALRAELPDFAPDNPTSCMASSIAATEEMETAISEGEQLSANIEIAGRFVDIAVAPILSQSGERQGVVVEWRDLTEATQMQREIDRVVSAAAQGEFASRVEISDPHSVLGTMGLKVNELLASVSRGLDDVQQVVRAMADRDLTRTMSTDYSGSFADLSQNVNRTLDGLRALLMEMADTSGSLEHASREMQGSAADIASRAESQAAALEETAANMEHMATTAKGNAAAAEEATRMTQSAAELAGGGRDIVRGTVDAIGRTESSSEKITEIISVMDSIAFQTNLLALNAAVEAARAGEAGKGFAVVASEVRALAQRSSDAARDIQELVSDSVVSVRESVGRVRETGEMIAQINQGVEAVNAHAMQISGASQEQAESAGEIREALNSLDSITQQNATTAELAAGQAMKVSQFADELSRLAKSFTLKDDGAAQYGEQGERGAA